MVCLKRVRHAKALAVVLCTLVLSACASSGREDPNLLFTPDNKTALVLGGTEYSGIIGCKIKSFVAVDSSTGMALAARPDYKQWSADQFGKTVKAGFAVRNYPHDTQIREVIPGEYVRYYDDNCMVSPRRTFDVKNSSANGLYLERVRINAGEIVYVGHLVGGAWVRQDDKVKKALATMKNLQGNYVFRPPISASELSPN